MEIEIGGRSEKSLGGQESAAVDQECMGSNASSRIFGLSFLILLSFFCWNRFFVGGSDSLAVMGRETGPLSFVLLRI